MIKKKIKLMSTVIGTSFDYIDILCYLADTLVILLWETINYKILSVNNWSDKNSSIKH